MDAVENGSHHQIAVERDGADGVVVAGNREIDAFRVAVAVDHGDHGNPQLGGFGHGDGFLVGVDHEQDVGQAAHLLDAAERPFQLVALAGQTQEFFLGQADVLVLDLLLDLAQALDGVGNGPPVGHHAAEPTVVYVVLAATLGGLGDRRGGLALGADKEHPPAAGNGAAHRHHGGVQHGNRLLQVDDVYAVADPEQVGGHLGVPTAGSVSEMNASLEKLAHGKLWHCHVRGSFSG